MINKRKYNLPKLSLIKSCLLERKTIEPMKRLVIILLVLSSLSACNNKKGSPAEIKAKINEYKLQIVDLEGKINDLKGQLSKSTTNKMEGSILIGVKKIKPEKFTHYLKATGNVEARKEAYISPELNGLLKSINVKEGEYVTKGQLMAAVDTEIIRSNIRAIETQLNLAQTIYKKQKSLWKQKIGSEIQYLQAKTNKESLERKLETLRTQLSMATITAPFDAYVETVYQKVGEMGSPSRQLFHIVNLKNLKVVANISESYIPFIHKGDMAEISFPTYPKIRLKAPVAVVGAVINPNNRTVEIQIPIKNIDNKLKPNIIAMVVLPDFSTDSAIIAPSIVIKNDANELNYVYVVAKKGNRTYAKKVYVKTAKSYGNSTMILSGLKKGDQLIVQGYNLVKNGSLVRLKTKK